MRAAFFDLDKTVIAKSSLLAWGPELHARGLLHRRTLVGAGIAQFWFQRFGADDKRLDRVRQAVLKVTRGWSRDQIRDMVRETVNEVIEPLLGRRSSRPEQPIPHVWFNPVMSSRPRLCLNTEWEWTTAMYIADTIVPWTIEWLAAYEGWRATGTWYAGGHNSEREHLRNPRRHGR